MAITKAADPMSARSGTKISGIRVLGRNQCILFKKLFRKADPITIGRTRQRSVRLRDDDAVSRFHCQIERAQDGSYVIRDCGSRNGIYVSELGYYSEYEKVDRCVLRFGMHIRLGNTTLTPVDADGEAPVMVKGPTDLLMRILRLYGSYREASRHISFSRETLRRRILAKLKKIFGKRSQGGVNG